MHIHHDALEDSIMGYHLPNLCFSMPEFKRRLMALRSKMKDANIDALITTTTENIFYLTGYQTLGYWFFQALVVPLESPPFMIVRALEHPNITQRTYLSESFTYSDNADPIKVFADALNEKGLSSKRLGVELNSYFLRNREYAEIQSALPNAKFEDTSGFVEDCRKIKSKAEIRVLKKAGRFTKIGMNEGLKRAAVGCSENDIAVSFYSGAIGAGGHYMAMPPFVASGPRSYLPHATYMNRTIEPNEFVLFEGAGSYLRYHAPCMRTIYTAKAKPWHKDIESILQDALSTTIAAMKPGITAGEVDAINQSVVRNNSFDGTQTSRSGYSVGIAFSPDWGEGHIISLIKGNDTVLEENMVFHVLSYIEIPATTHAVASRFGLSDTVYVTPAGGVSLINLPHTIHFV